MESGSEKIALPSFEPPRSGRSVIKVDEAIATAEPNRV
jgi:hypothetical protein